MKKLLMLSIMLFVSVITYAQYQFPACHPAWDATRNHYKQGEKVSLNGINYTAKYYTSAKPGHQSWRREGGCGDGGLGPDYTGRQRIIGYLPTWIPDYDIKNNFNPEVATHINVSFLMFKANNKDYTSNNFGSIAFDDFQLKKVDSVLTDCNVLSKAKAKNVKVSVALGGATDYAFLWLMTKYYNNDQKLEEIANLLVNYINSRKLDGIDLDLECWWADPAIKGTSDQGGRVRGSKWGDKDQGAHPAAIGLTNLSRKLRQKMPNKLITSAVFGTSWYGNNYDAKMADYMDWIGLMTYDFTGSWDKSPVGPHASLHKLPLGTYPGQSADNPIYSAQDALEYWLGIAAPTWNHAGGFGVKKSKLVIGVPMYGYDFSEKKPNGGNGAKFVPYRNIIKDFPNAATSYDKKDPKKLNGHIGLNGKNIYFDTPKQAAEKIRYTKKFGHQGVIIWELTQDVDYNSSSSILKAINEAAGNTTPINSAPVITWKKPVNNQTITTDKLSAIELKATAVDKDGTVSSFNFEYEGKVVNATKSGNVYTATFTPSAFGKVAVTAKAVDDKNASSTSVVNFVVKKKSGNNLPPVISNVYPKDLSVIEQAALSSVELSAKVTDDKSVSTVDFKINGVAVTPVSSGASNTYTVRWAPSAFGSFTFEIVATDNQGVKTTSTTNFTIKEKSSTNVPPVISGVNPKDLSVIEQTILTSVDLSANVTDDKSVSTVEFMVNGVAIKPVSGSSNSYVAKWTPSAYGDVSFKIVATDSEGASTTSTTKFTVKKKATGGGCGNIPQWIAKVYPKRGFEVQHNGNIYTNKWYASKGEVPGKSDVWKFVRACSGSTTFCGVMAWNPSKSYLKDEKAYYKQKIYSAKWWNKNSTPGTSTVWRFTSDCAGSTASTINEDVALLLIDNQLTVNSEFSHTSSVEVELYDISGRYLKTLVKEDNLKGTNSLVKDVSEVKSGLYIYKIRVNGQDYSSKILAK